MLSSKLIKRKYHKHSYSQCREDIILQFIFQNILKIKKPSFLDIGAHHPFFINNTALLYETGSTGINVEPNPSMHKLFQKYRPSDLNLLCGISEQEGIADYYMFESPTLNTFSAEEAEKLQKQGIKLIQVTKVPTYPLPYIIKKYSPNHFPDLLNIDVEGWDFLILKQIDFANHYPKVVCIETIAYSPSATLSKNHDIINFLQNKGYYLYADTYINSIFVKQQLIADK